MQVETTGDTLNDFKTFFDSYIATAAWTELHPDLEPEEEKETQEAYDLWKVDPKTEAECQAFYFQYHHLFTNENCQDANGCPTSQAGYDYWMTRNGHGVGFWETPDWKEAVGIILADASQIEGEVYF